MAHQLQALTWDQFMTLNDALVRNGLNNVDWIHRHQDFRPDFEH